MTKQQREILKGYLDSESSFPIHTIEYPAFASDFKRGACVKIVSSVKEVFPNEKWTTYVDYFAEDGSTAETRRLDKSLVERIESDHTVG